MKQTIEITELKEKINYRIEKMNEVSNIDFIKYGIAQAKIIAYEDILLIIGD